MELRHRRCFVVVAEAGSLTLAAERKLHTSQGHVCRTEGGRVNARSRRLTFRAARFAVLAFHLPTACVCELSG